MTGFRDGIPTRTTRLDRFFRVTERGSTIGREVRGDVTTFVAMSYIVLLDPLILGASADITGARPTVEQVTTATALAAGAMTILMGVVGNAPLALAAGLGVNGVVAFQLAPTMTWAQSFGLVVLDGLGVVVLAASGVRERIVNVIPGPLKTAITITIGISLYLALVGLVSAGFVTRAPDAAGSTVPVRMGLDGHLVGWPIAVFCAGLPMMIVLMARSVPGAVLISITAATVLAVVVIEVFDVSGWGLVTPGVPGSVVAAPDFGLFGEVGLVDGLGAVAGGVTGSSPNPVFLESAAGVGEGARTGLAGVVSGAMLATTLLFTSLAAVAPAQAAAPALVVIGGLVMAQCRRIPWQDTDHTIPVFLTAAVIPFTYSITNGIGAGLVSYVVLKTCKGQWRSFGWLMTVVAALFVVYFGVEGVTAVLR